MGRHCGLLVVFMAIAFLICDSGSAYAGLAPRRVPEPGTLGLLSSGAALLGGLSLLRRLRKK